MLQNKVINNQYSIIKKLSAGSFGIVYLGQDQLTKQEVAIKVEKQENEDVRSLEREIIIFKRLITVDVVPKFLWAGQDQGYNIIVLQLLGKDLAYHFKQQKKFSLKTALIIGIQLVEALEKLHQNGIIHRDLKPENLVFGQGKDSGKLFLIDFGISKIFKDQNSKHIQFQDKKSFLGTTRYASIAAHLGYELGRKDDLESMMYVLLYFIRGQLPWQNMQNVTDDERTKRVGEMKLLLQADLFRDQPSEFQKIFDYVRKLQFKSEPNYKMITFELRKAADTMKMNIDNVFEWTEIRSSTNLDSLNQQKSLDMKKSIEKQISGFIYQQNSCNLQVPLPQFSSRNTVIRDDQKKQTLSSIQGSQMCLSINPCYQPSKNSASENFEQETDLNSTEKNEFLNQTQTLSSQYTNLQKKTNNFMLFSIFTVKSQL